MNPEIKLCTAKSTARHYCFTAFQEPNTSHLTKNVRFICFQKEICPTTNKEHWQGYIQFRSPVRIAGVQELLEIPGAHCEKARGTPEQNINYCTKKETRVEGSSYTFGNVCKNQGARTDLEHIYHKVIQKGLSTGHLVQFGYISDTQLSYSLKLQQFMKPVWDRKPLVYWITGFPGTGKSKLAVDICGKDNTYMLSDNAKFWDGYIGQENIILDDLKPGFFSIQYLLRLLDRYPFRVEQKGSSLWFNGKVIVITSIYTPEELFNIKTAEDQYQLMRRIRYTILPSFFDEDEASAQEDLQPKKL